MKPKFKKGDICRYKHSLVDEFPDLQGEFKLVELNPVNPNGVAWSYVWLTKQNRETLSWDNEQEFELISKLEVMLWELKNDN